ncbi:MAG: hypothetical protein H6825_06850 [Planctomycetes bacterium]|nr:hypothetical protein [Planctomycetota bacterium]
MKNVIAVIVAGVAIGSSLSAQALPPLDLSSSDSLQSVRAVLAPQAFQEEVTVPASDGLVPVNTTGAGSFVFEGHVITVPGYEGVATKILYAPSEADDPAYRAAISANAGGAVVDYFDTRAATPSVATLSQYDAVYTWANFAYADPTGFGNNLATYNDAGGTVVLGVFCTYTSGNSLSGTIMTAGYCPVVGGSNHFTTSSYTSGGTSCIYDGVTNLTCGFRDILSLQGTGVADGAYADGEICHAYRGTGGADVVYSNGAGAAALGALGQWGIAVGHACTCGLAGPSNWTDEGSALGGVAGDPALAGAGSLAGGTAATLTLSNAAGSAMSVLVIAGGSSPAPFMGGTFLPGPAIVSVALTTSPAGGWAFKFRAPTAASGSELWAQAAIADGAAVQGVSLSNAVKGVTP